MPWDFRTTVRRKIAAAHDDYRAMVGVASPFAAEKMVWGVRVLAGPELCQAMDCLRRVGFVVDCREPTR
jgi:hypothetical protein